ncbi:MAG TPA: hypothetical protein VIH99_10625 [Bdellovibrionota bacterium]
MKHHTLVFLGLYCFACTGCGSEWQIQESKFYKYQNHDVRVAAKIYLTRESPSPLAGSGGEEFSMRLYSGNYSSILAEEKKTVGKSLEENGRTDAAEIAVIAIDEFRLGGTPNTYTDFCAEIKMEHSNVQDWRKIGCVNFVDTPSESPTGGLGTEWAE